MTKHFLSLIKIACTVALTVCCSNILNAQIVAFSNDFEDGNLDPEVGTATLVVDSATPTVVPVTGGNDPTLGNNVGLFDMSSVALDLTLNLTDTLSLADGNTVSIDFDVATRRSNGISRTIFVDAIDSNGAIVTRLVLGESNIFGGGGADRQRPGFATSEGNFVFGSPPGSFWWGADAQQAEFDATRDAHLSVTIGASSFDFATTNQGGVEFDATAVSNFDPVVSADIAEVRFTSQGVIHGMYYDNIVVTGVVADTGFLLGDVDLSGVVDFLDIAPFIALLSSGANQAEADIDGSGDVSFLDIAPFIAILSQ